MYAELREAEDREQEKRDAAAAASGNREDNHLSAVDELGMPKDGYDYQQHIRTMGGGTFVGTDGEDPEHGRCSGNSGVRAVLASALPVLATREAEMPQDRMFDAITLSTEGMPADVALALDSDYDDYDYDDDNDDGVDATQGRLINGKDGVFEELQLDFIQRRQQSQRTAMTPPSTKSTSPG